MAYGILKCDNITFDNGGSDQNVTVSGLYRATTSGVTVSGTIVAATVSGVTVIGSTTVSGATVTGTTANFTSGNFSNIISSAATMSGALIMANQQQVRFREAVGNGVNHIALQAPAVVSADQTITLPDQTGTVITTGDNGSVSSTMLATNLTISAAAGSAAAPSIAFTGDLNTGIYSPGADQLAVATNGTEKLIVLSNGNVGIGTSLPGNLLTLKQSIAASSDAAPTLIKLENGSDGGSAIEFSNSVAGKAKVALGVEGTGGATDDTFIGFSTSLNTTLSEKFRITSAGNVGIGTASPNAKLHVETIPQAVNQSGSVLFGPNTDYGLEIRNVIDGTGYPRVELRAPVAGAGPMLFFAGGATERLRIDSSGRLLVGTSTSVGVGAKLQTVDDSNANPFELIASPNNEQGPNFNTSKARGSTASPTVVSSGDILGRWRFRGYDGSAYQLGAEITAQVDGTPGANDMPGRLVFSVTADGAASPTERMRIDSIGNVGIGVSSPSYKLDVQGGVISAGNGTIYGGISYSTRPEIGSISNHDCGLITNNTTRMLLDTSGRLGIGTTSPTTLLDVNADTVRVRTARTPASASATGAIGEICWDASYIYVCTATNTWRRSAISSW